MSSRPVIIALLVFVLVSCDKNRVFSERHSFENLKWNRFEPVFFETDIEDTETDYRILVDIRHHTVYPFTHLELTLAIYGPSGERRLKNLNIRLKDRDGKFIAQGAGDLWDITVPAYEEIRFKDAGRYKFELESRMSKYDTPGLMEIGLIIEKTEY